jgi:hypothetical protein
MIIPKWLKAIPANVYVLVFVGIFAVTALFAYFIREDTLMLEKRILSRQKEVGAALQLRDSYEMKRRSFEGPAAKGAEQPAMSLAVIEELVAKSFAGGKLVSLQPTTTKEKGRQRISVDLKIAGAPLGEVVSFVKAAEGAGLLVARLRLSLPEANPMTLDVQATLTERFSNG